MDEGNYLRLFLTLRQENAMLIKQDVWLFERDTIVTKKRETSSNTYSGEGTQFTV